MNESDTKAEYERFLAERHRPAHARRTAERHAGFLLPHLAPGMRLLDAGCGPGSITLGLAERVAPGEVIGVDADAEAIEQARTLAAERGITNVRFEAGDVYHLRFEDGAFDAAFSNALLQHLADPAAAVRELARVLRPGGVIGLADADHDTGVVYPPDPMLERGDEIAATMRRLGNGGDVRIGKRLRALLVEAGFDRTECAVACGVEGSDARVRFLGEWQAANFEAPAHVARAAALGVSDEAELREIAAAWRRWAAAPGAIWAGGGFQCLGWKPEPPENLG